MPIELSKLLLAALRCPETRQGLSLAEPAILERVNRAIARGGVSTHGGTPLEAPVEAALIRDDGRRLYPISEGFPIMLIDEAIDLDGLPPGDAAT